MKRAIILVMVVAIAALFFIACGGGGSGSGGLGKGGFIKTLALGTATPWSAPFTVDIADHEQHLFFSQDINGSGYIESLSFRYHDNEPVSINCTDVTIMMGQTSMSALASTFASNVEQGRGSLVTVKSGALTAPAGSVGDYFTITLDTPFNYNGVDNLIVEFQRAAACDGSIRLQATGTVYTNVSLHKWNLVDLVGDIYDNYLNAKFTFEGGDNRLVSGSTGSNNFPFSTMNRRIQNLYLAGEIDGSGPVTGVAFLLNNPSTLGTYSYSVTMGHTTLSALGATFADNYNAGSPVAMADSATFTIPAGMPAGEWFWVPLPDATFTYNGTDNLIVEVGVTAATFTNGIRISNVADRRAYGPVGNDVADGVDGSLAVIKLRFNGGNMDVITDGGTNYIVPVASSINEYICQILYDNTALGTSGRITDLAFRLGSDSIAFDHTDVNLVLGHTTLSSLGGTNFTVNIESDRTEVFSGTIAIPSGLKAGDWVSIPLTTSFEYDATKSLVVQWDAPSYGTINPAMGHTEFSGRYADNVDVNLGDRTSNVPGFSDDFILDMSLAIDR